MVISALSINNAHKRFRVRENAVLKLYRQAHRSNGRADGSGGNASRSREPMKRITLTAWIFIAMVAGIAVGCLWPESARNLAPVSRIFLRLIQSIIAPLLFGTLVHGIAGSLSAKAMGRIGVKSIVYFEISTTAALLIGLGAVNLARPGEGITLQKVAAPALSQAPTAFSVTLEHTFPASVVDAMARGEILPLVVFCVLFGLACLAIGEKARPVVEFCKSLGEVMFAYTRYVMYLAPLGVGAALAATVGANGVGVLLGLGRLVLTFYAALMVFVIAVLGTVILVCRIPFGPFCRAVRAPFLLAFSTSSSEAAFPSAMEHLERLGVPEHIASFVLSLGYSFNLDGTTLYLPVACLFVAQAAGIHLSAGTQLTMMLALLLASKGAAGVPRAAMVIFTSTLGAFQLPLEGAALLLGVDAFLDMGRASVNLLGNCLAAAVIARWEGYPLSQPGARSTLD
jgi:proton glutamate symport protein